MKKTEEELIKHRIEIYQEGIKKAELEKDISSQMYLRGALGELIFLEQKLIDQSQEPKQMEVSEELQYQNLTCLVNGFELNTYQKGLAKQEYKKLLSMKEREQTEVSEDLINDIDKLILKWLNSQSENTTQLSFDIVTLFKSKTK